MKPGDEVYCIRFTDSTPQLIEGTVRAVSNKRIEIKDAAGERSYASMDPDSAYLLTIHKNKSPWQTNRERALAVASARLSERVEELRTQLAETVSSLEQLDKLTKEPG